jgi:hypothetical protein
MVGNEIAGARRPRPLGYFGAGLNFEEILRGVIFTHPA